MLKILQIFLILATLAVPQEHALGQTADPSEHHHGSSNLANGDGVLKRYQWERWKSKRERGVPYTRKPAEEERFSYWGYRHPSLHRRGIIDQILKTANSQCCGGAESGECRVTSLNRLKNEVMIDGVMCPISSGTKIVPVEGLENDEEAVVCAGQTDPAILPRLCPTTYCIGARSGI